MASDAKRGGPVNSNLPGRSVEDRLDAVGEKFDEWATDGTVEGMERRHAWLAERMFERMDFAHDARVLDIGCGDGWTARRLCDRMPEGAFVGIDVSGEMIRRARRVCAELDNALFAIGPAEQIPWADEYFTHIVSIESAYYWLDPHTAAREIHRVCSHGGSVHILINYYCENPYSEGWDRETGLDLNRWGRSQWTELFSLAGFEDVSTDQIPDGSPITPGKPPAAHARRVGLQETGALYVSGRKKAAPPRPSEPSNPFRVLG